jgi:hypothetical protein
MKGPDNDRAGLELRPWATILMVVRVGNAYWRVGVAAVAPTIVLAR